MKTLKIILVSLVAASVLTSCYREEIIVDHHNPTPTVSLHQLLSSYELWYVDINQTLGYGETPFLQIAFTLSFRNGVLFANNNLVGFGSQGNGFGIPVGEYEAYGTILDIYHDIDGYETFDVYQIDNNTIELYNPYNDTSYFLNGYQRSTFDYDFVFYDNIHYFLQEYEAWEKTYTSLQGQPNAFDYENYLQFLAGGNDATFRSSQDANGINPNNIYWDYTGIYGVGDVSGNMYLKTLTLDYDTFGNELFELNVITDARIELYHPASQTVYEFTGRGYIQYMKDGQGKQQHEVPKKRKQKTTPKENPRENKR
ncbi:MAG TPA: nicotinic acid mononucleotide adenyltransferase [Flavobacteriaceae bacterium]|nr:nicotinic acid mononucleotide adenyltransferase [Flavobacteriaceae bacterium]